MGNNEVGYLNFALYFRDLQNSVPQDRYIEPVNVIVECGQDIRISPAVKLDIISEFHKRGVFSDEDIREVVSHV